MATPPSRSADSWASGAAYEPYVGRWSRLVAREFLGWLSVPSGRRWLDVGCGTGALSQTILESAAPIRVTGIDASDRYTPYAREHLRDARARFRTGDAQALSEPGGTYDAAVSGLVLNFVPEPARAATEMARVTRARGVVAAYLWDYAGEMQLMRHFWDAAIALDPAARARDKGARFPPCHSQPLVTLFRDAGLAAVDVRAIDVPTAFRDFDDYWPPFLSPTLPTFPQ